MADNWELRPLGSTPKIPAVPFVQEPELDKKVTGPIDSTKFAGKDDTNANLNWEVKGIPDSSSTIAPVTWKDRFRNYVAPQIRGGMQMSEGGIGATLGTALTSETGPGAFAGGVAGGITGASIGDEQYQLLQMLSPRLFGSPPQSASDSIKEALINGVLNEGGNRILGPLSNFFSKVGTTSGKEQLKYSLQNLFKLNPTIGDGEIQKVLTQPAGRALNPTIGQFTQNSAAQHAEDIILPQEKLDLFSRQQKTLKKQAEANLDNISKGQFTGIRTAETSPADIGASATANAEQLFTSAKNSEKARWNNLMQVEVPKEIAYTTKNEAVQGPIHTNATTAFATSVSEQLEKAIEAQPDDATKTYLMGLKSRVDPLTTLPADSSNNLPVMGFEAAKDLRDKLKLLSKGKDVPPEVKREMGLIGALSDLLGKDINESVQTEWGPRARQAYNRAVTKTQQIAETFYNRQGNELLDYKTSNQAALEHALSSKEAALQFKKATGRGIELGTEYTRNILDKSLDVNGMFDGRKALQMFQSTGDIANVALTSSQRSSLVNLFRRMQGVDPNLVMSGQAAVAIRKGGAIFGIGGGLFTAMKTGNIPTGVATGGILLASLKSLEPLVRNVLMNPTNANLMAQLSHLPPKSSAAQNIIRTLFKTAFKGAQFETQFGDMTVNDDGKLEPTKSK